MSVTRGVWVMNVQEVIKKYQKELEKVEGILEKLEKVQGLAALGTTPETGLEELICKRYLQIGKVDAVLKEVNAAGCRKNGEHYKSTDISGVIKARKVEGLNPELHEAAKLLMRINKGKM